MFHVVMSFGLELYCHLNNSYPFCLGKELFIRFTVLVFRERLSICIYVRASSPFGFEGEMLNLIALLLPDHRLSFYFSLM